jgi:hypothetical protein
MRRSLAFAAAAMSLMAIGEQRLEVVGVDEPHPKRVVRLPPRDQGKTPSCTKMRGWGKKRRLK